MPIPNKENPLRYPVSTKLTAKAYEALRRSSVLEYNGNLSKLIREIIMDACESRLTPDYLYLEDLKDRGLKDEDFTPYEHPDDPTPI